MLLHFITLALLSSLAFCQQSESIFNVTCNPGYKLAGIAREAPDENGRVGPLTCICEQIMEADGDNPVCEQIDQSLRCDGTIEGCDGDTWMGGFTGIELSRKTGAMSLKPICCRDNRIRVVDDTCVNVRLNALRSAFDVVLRPIRVIREWQCWKIQSIESQIVDFIWKVNVCDWAPSEAGALNAYPRPSDSCGKCDCNCSDPVPCPANTIMRAIRVHKTRAVNSCQCQCFCDQVCA